MRDCTMDARLALNRNLSMNACGFQKGKAPEVGSYGIFLTKRDARVLGVNI